MRKFLTFCLLLFVGCGGDGGDGGGFAASDGGAQPTQHVPQILDLALSPTLAMRMDGGGSVIVTAQLRVQDVGLDIQTLWIQIPGGDRLEFDEVVADTTATLTEAFEFSTEMIGVFALEFWIGDQAGDSSRHVTAEFNVVGPVETGNWTNRLSGLPYVLNDVIWHDDQFIAVGDSGRILTSDDGIDWQERASFTEVDLSAIAADGANIVAVGSDGTVLLSIDSGASWITKHEAGDLRFAAVAVDATKIVVGGMHYGLGTRIILISEDLGETWSAVESWPADGHFLTDLVYSAGLFVAGTDVFDPESDTRLLVSADGKSWTAITLRNEGGAIYALVYDGSQFIAAGNESRVFASADGYNWTELPTPIEEVDYLSAAWNGSTLVVAGGISWWYWWGGVTPDFERPVGLSSTNGGASWEIFDIDGYYESRGMAWGSGRFVSVGQSTPVSGTGAIYTSE